MPLAAATRSGQMRNQIESYKLLFLSKVKRISVLRELTNQG